jgi:hypothetical protein
MAPSVWNSWDLINSDGKDQKIILPNPRDDFFFLSPEPTVRGKQQPVLHLNISTNGVNITTIEDPIDYRMPGINKSDQPQNRLTFAPV